MCPSDPTQRQLLIIEGDTLKLAAQGLSCADRVARVARGLGADPVVLKASSTATLLDGLGRASADSVFDAVVIIGHGNSDGLVLAPDRELVSWHELVGWLTELAPERLALISCRGGRTLAAHTLFDGLDHLEEVYASPLNVSLVQSRAIDFLLPALLDAEMDERYIRLVQLGKAVLTRGLLFRWTREEFEHSDDVSDVIATLAEEAFLPAVKELLDSWLPGSEDGPDYPAPTG